MLNTYERRFFLTTFHEQWSFTFDRFLIITIGYRISVEIYKFEWRKSFVCSLYVFLSIIISKKIIKKKKEQSTTKIKYSFYLLFYIVLYFIVIRKTIWSIPRKELIKKIKKNLPLIAKNKTVQLWAKKIYDLSERNVLQKRFCTKFGPLANTFTRVTVHLKKIECFAKIQTKILILLKSQTSFPIN